MAPNKLVTDGMSPYEKLQYIYGTAWLDCFGKDQASLCQKLPSLGVTLGGQNVLMARYANSSKAIAADDGDNAFYGNAL